MTFAEHEAGHRDATEEIVFVVHALAAFTFGGAHGHHQGHEVIFAWVRQARGRCRSSIQQSTGPLGRA